MKTLGINWEEVPQEYNYVAMDACGDVAIYICKPTRTIHHHSREIINCDFWVPDDDEPDLPEIHMDLDVEDLENYNWRILYERPSVADRDS